MATIKKNPKKKTVTLDLRAFLFIILVPILSVMIIVYLLMILTAKKEPVDEVAALMAGIYYGNNTYIENSNERFVKQGYSPSDYVELKDDWTCETNIADLMIYENKSGNCVWGVNENLSETDGHQYYLNLYKDSLVRFGNSDFGNYRTIWFDYDDNNKTIIIYSGILKKK